MKEENIIAFSLWGSSQLYCQGAIDNIECAKKFLPDWTCRFYVAQNCPALPVLQKLDCQVVVMPFNLDNIDRTKEKWTKQNEHTGMMWRFHALNDESKYNKELSPTKNVAFCDCDSRIAKRSAEIINSWLLTNTLSYRIHEVLEHHNAWAMGGMWGCKTNYIQNIDESIDNYIKSYNKSDMMFIDLWYIMDILRPQIEYSCVGYGFGHPNEIISEDKILIGTVVNEEWRNQTFSI